MSISHSNSPEVELEVKAFFLLYFPTLLRVDFVFILPFFFSFLRFNHQWNHMWIPLRNCLFHVSYGKYLSYQFTQVCTEYFMDVSYRCMMCYTCVMIYVTILHQDWFQCWLITNNTTVNILTHGTVQQNEFLEAELLGQEYVH